MSDAQLDALERLSLSWLVPVGERFIDPVEVFGRRAPLVVEIGFGMGTTTVAQAVSDPATDVLAIDVHTPGVASLLVSGEQAGVTNVRVVHGDAVEVVEQMLAPESVTGVRAYFPDPWPKAKHRKRRLIQPDFVALLVSTLTPGGFIHCATDVAGYADQMVEVLDAHPELVNPFQGLAPGRLDRPVTKFERRALARGHPISDVWVTRRLTS